MARELSSSTIKTEQPDPIEDFSDRDPEVVLVDAALINKEYEAELAFMAEWVTVRLEESGEENAPTTFPVWINGRGAEILHNGRPLLWTHLPIGEPVTVRRSVVEVIARSKKMRVQTDHDSDDLRRQIANVTHRRVSASQPVSIIRDPNPRGAAWFTEMVRRQF